MNKKRYILIVSIILIGVFSLVLLNSKLDNKETKLDEVKLKENKVNNKGFAIMIQKEDGSGYDVYGENTWPTNMVYNSELSGCIDNYGSIIENSMSYNQETNKVTINTRVTSSCYLYFDLDKVAPQVFTFYLGGSTNKEYVTSTSIKTYLSWSDNDIEKYCLTTEKDSTNCAWNNVSNSPMEIDYTLSSGDGTKTVNAYLKDMAGNISPKVSDSIVLDTTPPKVTAIINNNNSTNATMTITSNEAGTYCVNTSATSTESCTFSGSITAGGSITTNKFTTKGDYYAHVTDGAGYVGHSSKLTITLTTPLGEYLINNSISGLDKTIISGDTLYRFSGTSGNTGINNYICLGTTSKCTSGSDNMYRIIGVEPSTGYVKVVKQIKHSATMAWNSSNNVTYPNSSSYSAMLTWYNSTSFKDMIVSHTWNIGDIGGKTDTYIGTRTSVLNYESSGTPVTAYVGMIAVSDYYLAYKGDQNWNLTYSNYTSNWIFSTNNENTSAVEWTMSRFNNSQAWVIYNTGAVVNFAMGLSGAIVRPTFFLDKDVLWKSGTGTSTDPFIVS